ncbi:MAG: hypothetical protein ACLVCW_06985 [Campylobacter sp.]
MCLRREFSVKFSLKQMTNFCDRERGILQRNLKFWYRYRVKFTGTSGICAVKFHFAADFALEFFGREISRRKINATETARRRHFVKALAAFAAKTYCGFRYAAELRVWYQQCAPFGRKYISFRIQPECVAARSRLGR